MQDTVKIDREKYIGGSDIPTIMGISKYNKRFDLLQEKAGIKENDFCGNVYTKYGQAMEEKIRNYINADLPSGSIFVEGKHYATLSKDGFEVSDIEVRCHTDGENNDTILEIKTTGKTEENIENYKDYLVQLLFYMYWAMKPRGVLAVYNRPDDMSLEFDVDRLQLFEINLADYTPLMDEILEAVYKFVGDLHRLKENPFLTEEELMPKDISVMADGLAILEQKISEYKAIQEEYERQKEGLLNAMQKAGVYSFETDNGYLITAIAKTEDKIICEDKINLDKLRAHKRIYKEVVERIETVKKGKKAYLRITKRS